MNILDRAIRQIAPGWGARRARSRAVLAHYDAATLGRRTSSLKASGTDADAAGGQRQRLSWFARDIVRNTPFGPRAQMVIASSVVGDGIVPKVSLKQGSVDDDLRRKILRRGLAAIEDHLDTTAIDRQGRANFYGLQRQIINTVVDSGECLVRVYHGDTRRGGFPLQIDVLEPDYLDQTRFEQRPDGGETIDGIEYDAEGRRTAYWLFPEHPGATRGFGRLGSTSERIPADRVMHIYRVDRPGQQRGVSWFAPVMMRLMDLADHEDAQLMRQKIAACFAAFRVGGDQAPPMPSDIRPGMIYDLAGTEDVKFSNPPPAEAYDEFTRSVLRSVAAGLGISYEALTGDLAQVNFSSARMGRLEMDANVSAWQWLMFVPQFLEPFGRHFLRAWLSVDGPRLIREGHTEDVAAHLRLTWVPPRKIIVDPAREFAALREAVRAGFTSRQAVVRQLGIDPERLLEEIAQDRDEADRLGLPFDSDPRADVARQSSAALGVEEVIEELQARAQGVPQHPPSEEREMNELLLYGTVGSSFWEEESFTAKGVREALGGMSGPLTVRINSGGGIATEGQAIYTALRGYQGEVHVVVEGIAASAASLIAMAGDTITMSLGSIMMIHDPATWWTEGRGTEDDHLHTAKSLAVIANAYAGIYAKRAGITIEEARGIMRAETYYDGPAAVEAGFATAADDEGEAAEPAAFDYRLYDHPPENLRAAAGLLPRRRSHSSVLAMMAGAATPSANGGKAMAKPNKSKVTATTAADEDEARAIEEDEPEAEQEDEPEASAETEDDPEDDEEEAHARASSPSEALAILRACNMSGVEAARGEAAIRRGLTCAQFVAELNGRGNGVRTRNHAPRSRIVRDETDTRLEGMIGALMGRSDGPAGDYRGLRIKRLAMELGGMGGRGRGGFADAEIVRRGMRAVTMTGGAIGVSDFAYITTEVMRRSLMAEYQRREPSWRLVTGTPLSAADFREVYAVRFGGDFQLKDVLENGEYQNATLVDEAEGLKVQRRGRTITLSFEAVINDDMGAFQRIPREFATAARTMESGMVWSLIRGNAVLRSDGKAIFHADHGNLAAAPAAISVTSIGLARKSMAEMRAFGSKDPDDFIEPEAELLIVPPALEVAALQFVSETVVPTKAGDVNPYRSRFSVHTVPNIGAIAGGSDTAWYLFDSGLPPVQHAYLSGYEAPTVETIDGMNPDAVKMNARHIFGAAAVEFRGSFKNAGA